MADRGPKSKGKAPAGKGGKQAAAKKGGEDEREEILQAVVLADDFETRFSPFSLEKPRCLLPLANTPLLEYTLEFLAMNGVSDIYIYCGAHTSEVEEYVNASKWHPATSPASPFANLEILKSAARSVGDALRDIDSRGIITGDFFLVHGDLISNFPLDAALARHKERRNVDKNAIMTLVLREGGPGEHRTKSHGVTPVFLIDPTKNRCLHYEELSPVLDNKYLNIDPDLLSSHQELEVRTDLMDCGIDICTPDVLALWSGEFDYEMPRRHFLHGVLKDYELNGKMIYAEIATDHYAARVSNLQLYESISKDILGRWTFPLVPDSNLVSGQTYKYSRGGICKEDGVILARSCKVGNKTVLGKDTSIGDGTVVSNSIIGRRCQIGKNATIEDAFIWDDVVIDEGAQVKRAIIASEAVIGKNCHIEPGSLLSFGVRIAEGKTIIGGSRITRAKKRQEDYDKEEFITVPADADLVGQGGDGYLFEDDFDDLDDSEANFEAVQTALIYSTTHLNLSTSSVSTLTSTISADEVGGQRSRLSSFTGSISDDDSITAGTGSGENFHKDAVADVYKILNEEGDFHNLRVEFTSLRLANNATDHQVRRAIAVGFTKYLVHSIESGVDISKAVTKALDSEGAVAFLSDVAIGKQKEIVDQVDFLLSLQKDLLHREKGDILLFSLCRELYDRDVLEEEGFETWWEDPKGTETAELRKVRERAEVFITWLKEAEEEDSDEEEDDDD